MAAYAVEEILRFSGSSVRVRLEDGTVFSGRLRTELLSEGSLSVYITSHSGEGVTLYIDQIAEIVPLDAPV